MSSSEQSAQHTAAGARAAQTGTVQGDATSRYVPRQASAYEDAGTAGSMASGLTMVAAILMLISGIWNFLEGLAAIVKGSFFIVLPNYAYNISVTGWGWFHLIVGAVVAAAGAALFTGRFWARMVGVFVVSISAIVNFLYIPYQPVWSIALIAIDGVIIWALLARRRDYI
jgi:hypothetical protein